jgi:hypothetical protein
MLIPIFYFDDENFFAYEGKAQKIGNDVLMPENATQKSPDMSLLQEKFAKWNEESQNWDYIEKPKTAKDFLGVQISHKSQTVHNQELRQLVQALVNEDPEHFRVIRGSEEEGLWWGVEEIPEKTQDEKDLEQTKADEQAALAYLRSTDYVAVKIAEGVATKEEYAEILQKRAEKRDEVNALRASQESLSAKIAESKA